MKFLSLILLFATMATAMGYTHFEPRQQHPIALTPDGRKLLALHSTAHSLAVFDVGTPPRATPVLVNEIPLATAPVTVKARTNDEAWVVNEGSDSISIISLSLGMAIATLPVGDEPADICFTNGKAFVSCSQARTVFVFDAVSRASLGQIVIDGIRPSAMVASADGSKLYVASLYSGNRTTILPETSAPPQSAPTNTTLPAPPRVGLIVPSDDGRIAWNVLDHDIAEINTTTQSITRWITGVGTHLYDLAIHPDGSLWCANSESLNLTRFEPELNGHFSKHRLSRIPLPDTAITHHDLNPDIPRATSPAPASIAIALAGPTALTFRADGQRAWVAAFQSDRIAEIDPTSGMILRRINVRPTAAASDVMRGPRGLALTAERLYVLNKISDSLTTIDPANGAVLSETPLGSIDPMPANIRAGRGLLYDARLSGNGTISCATCHLDADRDGLAWDLGDPAGEMISIPTADLSAHDYETIYHKNLHPMKGPLTTQTLRGLALNDADPIDQTDGSTRPAAAIVTKFHWRGDKPSIQSFNSTFSNLMGGTQQSPANMEHLAEYLRSITLPPNPNLNLDGSLRTNLPQGDAVNGRHVFLNHVQSHCMVCHTMPGGTDQNIDSPDLVEKGQPMKNPSLRTVYQRADIFNPMPGADSLSGFGLGSDGSSHELPIAHPYFLAVINRPPINTAKAKALADLTAFILSFDTGTAPSATHSLTLHITNRSDLDLLARLGSLETGAAARVNGLVAWGRVAGILRRYQWDPSSLHYLSDDQVTSYTRAALLDLLTPEDALTFAGVLPSEVTWRSTDRNDNGTADTLETIPKINIQREGDFINLRWPRVRDWYLESSPNMLIPWHPAAGDWSKDVESWHLAIPLTAHPSHFYRLRRTW